MRDLHFDEYSRETFHYLQGLSNINYEGLWLNPAISIFAVGLVLYTVETTGRYDVKNRMLNWVSACHAVDCDVDVPGESFLETTIERFGNPENLSADGFNTHCHTFIPIFDLILDEVIGTCPTIGSEISMAFVALKLFWQLGRAWKIACIAANASDILTVSYHKYYVDRIHAETFKFLEHVMERAIEQRPDCIFDTFGCYGYDNCTICILFIRYGYWDIWADILEDNGFDPDWVDEEDEKRCLARTAKTSAHEVIADVDAARALEVKRRRGYVNTEE
ncbi:hypothetical protein F4818DRAFT_396034 [Hypoxylon cercidicola]|nr:hypothetical protein F4818DRAFT_396034 [Hypoxylon cercidicola]